MVRIGLRLGLCWVKIRDIVTASLPQKQNSIVGQRYFILYPNKSRINFGYKNERLPFQSYVIELEILAFSIKGNQITN